MDVKIKKTLEISEKKATETSNEFVIMEEGVSIYELGTEIELLRGKQVVGTGKIKKIELTENQTKIIFELKKLNGVN